jgi:predicted AlkP superfamily phosphohydrolase/phosphomutase
MSGDTSPNRTFVLGLDGVPYERLRAWADAGELPNFAALFEEGAAGPLVSTKPANTALAWPSITTGVWPDKHGVYAFYKLGTNYRHRVNTGEDVDRPALWEMVSPSAVVNVPMTYPASDIDGRMVTGMMTPSKNEGFTHPPELATRIDQRVPDYEIGLDWNEYQDRPAEFPAALESLVASRRRLMHELLDEDDWRLLFYVYTAPDRLQHLIWEEDVLLQHYKQLDAVVGDAREHAAAHDMNLFVVSDHGFGPIEKNIHVNRVLANEGYLTPKDDTGTRSTLSQVGLTKERVLGTLRGMGIDTNDLAKRLPQSLVDRLAEGIPGDNVRYDVDYGRTKAFVHAQGTLYINDTERFEQGIVEPSEVEPLKEELTSMLTRVRDTTGETVLDVHDGDTLFPSDDTSPDLVVEPREGYYVKPSLAETVFTDPGAHAADHRPDGIFLAAGPDIAAGATPTDASVVDVAPTVLHGMGEAIPADTDGRVLDEIFAADSPTATRSVSRTDYARSASESRAADEDFSDVEDRLRGLGYVE